MSSRRYRAHLAGAALVLVLAIYLSSGTMAPYAATLARPLILEPCHYLGNADHSHFEAVYRFIAGEDPSGWAGSVVLRRLLYPVLSYPLVRLFGFLAGGLVASIALHVVALLAFAAFVKRRVSPAGAVAVMWLIATYPGITYWAGLPYSYAAIVPASLFGLILLYRIGEATTARDVALPSLLLGLIFVAYDLLPFFGAAAVLTLVARRQWLLLLTATAGLVLPLALVALMFVIIVVPVLNSNTATYVNVVRAWIDFDQYGVEWLRLLMKLPLILISTAAFSNLLFLPVLTAVAWFIGWRRRLPMLMLPEKALALAALLLFVFTNAAPPYYGWQMRGEWLARLYQPVFVVLLMVVARVTAGLDPAAASKWRGLVAATVVLNASIAFGPALRNPVAGWLYHKFYVHSPPETLLVNLERFGRRPLGFCDPAHRWDHLPDPTTPENRPAYMYRYP